MKDNTDPRRLKEPAERTQARPRLSDTAVNYLLIGLLLLLALAVFLTAYLSVPAMRVTDYEKAPVRIQPVGYAPASEESRGDSVIQSDAPFVLNPNTASAEELERLPGIGEVTAERIVSYRQAHGAFTQLSDLLKVKGIGQATYREIAAYLTLEVLPSAEETTSSGTEQAGTDTPDESSGFPIDLNAATASDLIRVPGIGEATARSILDYREQLGRFDSLEQLLNVKGIGEKKLAAFREYLTVTAEDAHNQESAADSAE